MKINIEKVKNEIGRDDVWITNIYQIECFCGTAVFVEGIPEWFECPKCNRKISLFKKYVRFKKR